MVKIDQISEVIECNAKVHMNKYLDGSYGMEAIDGTELIMSKDEWIEVIRAMLPYWRQSR